MGLIEDAQAAGNVPVTPRDLWVADFRERMTVHMRFDMDRLDFLMAAADSVREAYEADPPPLLTILAGAVADLAEQAAQYRARLREEEQRAWRSRRG